MKFSSIWRTAFAWGVGMIFTVLIIPFGLLAIALDPWKQRVVRPLVTFWGRTLIRFCFIEIRVSGLENIKNIDTAIFAANHQGMVDIFLLFAFIKTRIVFLAKKQVLYTPLVGQMMPLLGHIMVDRSNPKKALKSVQNCIKAVKQGCSMAIFPEGTRSDDGKLKPFKGGSLKIAIRSGVPVVPVTICGSFNVIKKNSIVVSKQPIAIHFGKPIESKDIDIKDFRPFISSVYDSISKTKDRIESEQPDTAPVV